MSRCLQYKNDRDNLTNVYMDLAFIKAVVN